MTQTLAALIAAHPDDDQALGAPDRVWLNYSGLRSLAADVAQTLHRAGIGRGDRVAIVLPNGPEKAFRCVQSAEALASNLEIRLKNNNKAHSCSPSTRRPAPRKNILGRFVATVKVATVTAAAAIITACPKMLAARTV